MKNKHFLKQNLFILIAVLLGFIVGFWLYPDRYSELWEFSLSLLTLYIPLILLQLFSFKRYPLEDISNRTWSKAIEVILWFGLLLTLYPMLIILYNNLYYLPMLSLFDAYHSNYELDIIKNIFEEVDGKIYYFIVAGLLYLAIKSKKEATKIITDNELNLSNK